MNRIESRPAHSGRWQYVFFIDVSGHVDDDNVAKAMSELGDFASDVKVLGSYPVALL
jgi:chorismate mutase/prephenate dehydratase